MSTSILDVIGHYQRSIERAQKQSNLSGDGKSAKFLHCIEKLNKLPVKVEHLQATGIGKTVNSLRKSEGEVGAAAKALVAKWKAVVTAEEQAKELAQHRSHRNDDDGGNGEMSDGVSSSMSRLVSSSVDPNGNMTINSNNGYTDNQINSSQNFYNQNQSAVGQGVENMYAINQLNVRPTIPLDPNYIHTIDDDDDDDNDVQLIIDENVNNSSKTSPPTHASGSVVNINSHKNDNETNEITKNRDNSKKDKYDKHHSSSGRNKHSSEHRKSSHSKTSSETNNVKHNEEKLLSYEPPSAAEVCQEEMDSDQVLYDNGNEKVTSSNIPDEEYKSNSKDHKSSHQDVGEHSNNKKKKSKKHKEKKSKSKHHDSNDESNKQTSSKHDKKHKDKHSKDKSSKEKKSKEVVEPKPENSQPEKFEEDGNDNHPQHGNQNNVEYQNEIAPTVSSNKNKKTKTEIINNNGFDSTTGASFEQALGMMEVPSKKSKNKHQNDPNQQLHSMTKKRPSRDEPSGSGVANKKPKLPNNISPKSDNESDSGTNNLKYLPLLAPNANLTPLDPNIALDLPAISNNYKPLPLNPTVMDCVFPQSKPQRLFTDEEALAHGISSKTIRTKVYSGAKTGQKVQIPSLFDLCIRCLQKNIDALEYTGGVPFDILKPVLERATPEQLQQFEEYNPYLMEDTDVLWEHHVKRRFRSYKREEMESFREMYFRCKESQDAHLNRLTENIKQSQKKTTLPQRKTQLAYVDSLVKPPRYVKKKQEKFGTNDKLVATPAARVASLQAIAPNAAKSGDARLKVATGTRDTAQASSAPKSRKAPLMQKTLQFMRGRIRR